MIFTRTVAVLVLVLQNIQSIVGWCDPKHQGNCLLQIRGSIEQHVENSEKFDRGMEFYDHHHQPFGKVAAVPVKEESGIAELQFEVFDVENYSENTPNEPNPAMNHIGQAVLSANGSFSVLGATGETKIVLDTPTRVAEHSPTMKLQVSGKYWGLTHDRESHSLLLHTQSEEESEEAKRVPVKVDFEAPTDAMVITENGEVGIGNPWPSVRLDVNGGVQGTSAYSSASDVRFKTNIENLSSNDRRNLDLIGKLQGVKFDWRHDEFPSRAFPPNRQVGFIAQEVEKILPEVVRTNLDGYKAIEYSSIVPVLVEAIKEQTQRANETESKLERRISALEDELNQMRKAIQDMRSNFAKLS